MSVSDKFVEFIKNTISGHESGLYKLILTGKLPFNREILLTPNVLSVVVSFAENYFNKMYESLVDKKDEYVNENFNIFCSHAHSEVCIINILATLTLDIQIKLDRSKLDISNYDNYMSSLDKELDYKLSRLSEKLEELFKHICSGSKGSASDKKMFTSKI